VDQDDVAYRKSVRNMSFVLAAMAIIVVAGILAYPYLYPASTEFQKKVSLDSPYGFTLHLEVNTTSPSPGGHVAISAWANSTYPSVQNVTGSASWPVDSTRLWGRPCTGGFPIGVGVMRGHYSLDNYTLGSLVQVPRPLTACPEQPAPKWFVFEPAPHSSVVLVSTGGSVAQWLVQTTYDFGPSSVGQASLPPGVYTAVGADEWGDLLLTSFAVP
jgi:hypothetical protein